jgi:uncharacterized protein YggE
MNKILAALYKMGINKKDIQTIKFQSYPNYEYSNNKKTLKGYRVEHMLKIKYKNLDKIGAVYEF